MKSPAVYPVSADLSALLGATVDVDAAWAEPLGPPTWPMPVLPIDPKAEAVVSEMKRRMNGLEALRAFADSRAMVTDIPEDTP